MSSKKNNTIKAIPVKQEKFPLTIKAEKIINNIKFVFADMKTDSIQEDYYNNCYRNISVAQAADYDLIYTLIELSKLNITQLNSPANKDFYHFNHIEDDKTINKINIILKKGFGCNDTYINEFENDYYEISITNGQRFIFAIIDRNIFSIIFLDPNHFVYDGASRDLERKKEYKTPSLLSRKESLPDDEISLRDNVSYILQDAKDGNIKSVEEYTKLIEDLVLNV